MDNETSDITTLTDQPPERRKRLRNLIILIILISIGVHVIAGIGAGIWVIARYFAQPKAQFVVQKTVNMTPEDREHRMQMEEVTSLRPKPVFNNRIQSLRPSKLALPELPQVPLETITPIDTDALISDQVDGIGKYGQGSGSGGGFFGGKGVAGSGLLAGEFYDLKQDAAGNKKEITTADYLDVVNRVSRAGNADSILRDFYKAPDTLYLAKLAVPLGKASAAPKAFKVEGKVQPRYWLAVYRGRMTAPETGNFRFVGFADDILLVKINGRLVLDGSLLNASRLFKKEGLSFRAEKGKAYDIEVIIGEAPGGYFSAWLQIGKVGGDGLHWFRMSDEQVRMSTQSKGDGTQKFPHNQKNGPVWRPAPMKSSAVGVGF